MSAAFIVPQGSVIEDGSFDDGDTYFLFNPGEPLPPGPGGVDGNTEYQGMQQSGRRLLRPCPPFYRGTRVHA